MALRAETRRRDVASRGGSAASRAQVMAMLLLPGLTAAFAAGAWLFRPAPSAWTAARVYVGDGPLVQTRGSGAAKVRLLALRVVLLRGSAIGVQPVPGACRLQLKSESGTPLRLEGHADANGVAHFNLRLVEGEHPEIVEQRPLELAVSVLKTREHGGVVEVGQGSYPSPEGARAVERRGGWVKAETASGWSLWAGALRGVLAVPFADQLLVAVRAPPGVQGATPPPGSQPLSGFAIRLELEGAEAQHPQRPLVTGDDGLVRVPIVASDHVVLAHVAASRGELTLQHTLRLPTVPGAMLATFQPPLLLVQAPTLRQVAYVDILSQSGRLATFGIPLQPDAGGASGSVAWTPPQAEPLWAMTSSEADMRSMGVVGWPLQVGALPSHAPRAPRPTLKRAQRLVIDSVAAARRAAAARARQHLRYAGYGVLGAGGLQILLFVLLLRGLARPFTRGPRSAGWVLIAVGCVVLGYSALALLFFSA